MSKKRKPTKAKPAQMRSSQPRKPLPIPDFVALGMRLELARQAFLLGASAAQLLELVHSVTEVGLRVRGIVERAPSMPPEDVRRHLAEIAKARATADTILRHAGAMVLSRQPRTGCVAAPGTAKEQ